MRAAVGGNVRHHLSFGAESAVENAVGGPSVGAVALLSNFSMCRKTPKFSGEAMEKRDQPFAAERLSLCVGLKPGLALRIAQASPIRFQ